MKTKIQIKSIIGKLLFEYESNDNTIKKTLVKAFNEDVNLEGANLEDVNLEGANLEDVNLEGANLRGANLEDVNLEGANLEGANLRGVNLRGANLRGVNLRGVNLRGVNLRGANLRGVNLIQFNGFGSFGRLTTYDIKNDKIFCGCFYGSLKEFKMQVDGVYKKGNKYNIQYNAMITMIKKVASTYK